LHKIRWKYPLGIEKMFKTASRLAGCVFLCTVAGFVVTAGCGDPPPPPAPPVEIPQTQDYIDGEKGYEKR